MSFKFLLQRFSLPPEYFFFSASLVRFVFSSEFVTFYQSPQNVGLQKFRDYPGQFIPKSFCPQSSAPVPFFVPFTPSSLLGPAFHPPGLHLTGQIGFYFSG